MEMVDFEGQIVIVSDYLKQIEHAISWAWWQVIPLSSVHTSSKSAELNLTFLDYNLFTVCIDMWLGTYFEPQKFRLRGGT